MTIKKAYLLTAVATVFFFLFDQAGKYYASTVLVDGIDILPFFGLKLHQNTGIAWSLAVPYWILIPLNFILLGLIIYFAIKYFNWKSGLTCIITALVIAGATGNIFDRLFRGAVIDFISIGFWPVFNLADSFLTIGIFLGIVFYGKIKKDH